jgi:hypothetical protein
MQAMGNIKAIEVGAEAWTVQLAEEVGRLRVAREHEEARKLEEAKAREEQEEAKKLEEARVREEVQAQVAVEGGVVEGDGDEDEHEAVRSDAGESKVESRDGESPDEDMEVQPDKKRKWHKGARDSQDRPRVWDPPCWHCKGADEPCLGPPDGSCNRCWSLHKLCSEHKQEKGKKGGGR